MPEYRSESAAVAFGLVITAGASTAFGAAVVFFPTIVKPASRRVLAGSLGFLLAGVMTYVSFIEIFQKALTAFQRALSFDGLAYTYTTLCFFGGVLVMMLLNALVAWLLGDHGHRHDAVGTSKDEDKKHKKEKTHKTTREDVDATGELGFTPPCCSKDPVHQLDTFQKMASVLQHEKESENGQGDDALDLEDMNSDDDFLDNLSLEEVPTFSNTADRTAERQHQSPGSGNKRSEEQKRLEKMGMNTALAIGLHNFPEGLATFVAALDDPKVGAVLAVAISIHNIPEGLCVALPIFYATGKRLDAFLWALLSGASEVVAAFLGWLILANVVSDVVFGVLFGLVAGMMVIISVRELIPTAHVYDPEDTVVTHSFIAGMIVIALSLVLFQI